MLRLEPRVSWGFGEKVQTPRLFRGALDPWLGSLIPETQKTTVSARGKG